MKKVLKNKLFLATFCADLISNFGDSLYYLALMNYIVQLPNSQFAISVLGISETLPMLLSLPLGVKADKTKNKMRSILLTLLLRAGLYTVVGLLMGFEPALWIVFIACGINFISDLSGQYENGLFSPVSLRIVSNEDREAAMALKQTVRSASTVGFQLIGALLIGFMSYQQLAFVNAGTFVLAGLIMVAVRPAIQGLLDKDPIKEAATDETAGLGAIAELFHHAKVAFVELMKIDALRLTMVVIPVLNAVFGAIDMIFLLFMKANSAMVLGNAANTMVILTVVLLVGQIVGGLLATTLFKRTEILLLVRISATFPAVLFTAFLSQQIYLVFFVLFLAALSAGAVNPKMDALMMNSLPEERLATIGAGISSYFTAGMILMRVLTAGAILVLSAVQLSLIYLTLSLFLLGYVVVTLVKK